MTSMQLPNSFEFMQLILNYKSIYTDYQKSRTIYERNTDGVPERVDSERNRTVVNEGEILKINEIRAFEGTSIV